MEKDTEKHTILVGSFRGWSEKSPAEKERYYREEAGADYQEVKAELEALAGRYPVRHRSKFAPTKEQRLIRELQSAMCKGRYRAWEFGAR